MKHCRVGLAMPPSVFRAGLRMILGEDGAPVRTFAAPGEVGPARVPDVLVVEPPEEGWAPVLRRLDAAGLPPQRVLTLCTVDGAAEAADLLAHGLAGCIAYDDPPETVRALVYATARGDWATARRSLFRLVAQPTASEAPPPTLTRRERDVLHLLACGMTNARIAEQLFIAHGTVRNLVSALYRKLGVGSRGEAILWAWKHGLGEGAQ